MAMLKLEAPAMLKGCGRPLLLRAVRENVLNLIELSI